jgi:hypothetical protein
VSVTRTCDYCEKTEQDAGFVQHYVLQHTRVPLVRETVAEGIRAIDLCKDCALTLTHESSEEPRAVTPEPKPVVVIDGKGNSRVPRTRMRPGRCRARHPKSGTLCVWDDDHVTNHQAANGQSWPKP